MINFDFSNYFKINSETETIDMHTKDPKIIEYLKGDNPDLNSLLMKSDQDKFDIKYNYNKNSETVKFTITPKKQNDKSDSKKSKKNKQKDFNKVAADIIDNNVKREVSENLKLDDLGIDNLNTDNG